VGGEVPINRVGPKKMSFDVADLVYGRPAVDKNRSLAVFVGWHASSG